MTNYCLLKLPRGVGIKDSTSDLCSACFQVVLENLKQQWVSRAIKPASLYEIN